MATRIFTYDRNAAIEEQPYIDRQAEDETLGAAGLVGTAASIQRL